MADLQLVLCVPCQSTGESFPAVKYCINCSDPLCKTCVEFHLKFRSTKSHKLVDCSTQDTRHFKGAKQLSIYMTCPDHDDSTVKLLCEEHGALCCLTCATTTHRSCRNVSEINKFAAGCKTSGKIDKIRTRLEGAGTCMQEIIDVNDACRNDFENSREEIPRRLEEIKRKILKLFEKMESAVLETVKNLHTDEDIAMGNREENWKLKLNANAELLEMLDAIIEVGTESQVFVALHRMKSTLLESENALSEQGSHIVGQRLNLKLKDKLENFMQTDVIDNLVFVESIQNQYQLPKTIAYSKPGYDIEEVVSASDSIQDSKSEEKTTEPSDKRKMKEDEKVKHPETDMSTEKCPICMDTFDNPKKLSKCGHVFCTDCIRAQFKVTPKCPDCFMVYGVIMGDQPEGKMTSYTDCRTRLPGYDYFPTIVITYDFPDGVQGPDHPQPGTRYRGIRRNGYLPDNEDGRQILKMLKIAFERKLVFTIGNSRTTGKKGVIIWNDIHHKTDPRPDSTFGYPDPSYLERVKDELAAKGVTPADIK